MSLWGGRFEKQTAELMKVFSSSIDVDQRLAAVDMTASLAHVRMLGRQGILSEKDTHVLLSGLSEMLVDLEAGKLTFDMAAEDVHGEIERLLFDRVGEAAKRMHMARSRNDQVATDTRLYLSESIRLWSRDLHELQAELVRQAEGHVDSIMPGMTHLQHAQPVSLAHHLLAYFWMFDRDRSRLWDSLPRVLSLPLGSAALAGTGFPIDRRQTQAELGFVEVAANSLDAVSDRDFVLEFLSSAAIAMMHLTRLCEELILWSTPEFSFVELGDEVTTGSSIMPQKKNPDAAELIRGRSGRVYGALMGALTLMKALPLSYNRDMQEDKVHLFTGLDTVRASTQLMVLILKSARWNVNRMNDALAGDFSNATDLADDLASKGVSFREAHEVVGRLVRWCLVEKKSIERLTLSDLRAFHSAFDESSLAKVAHQAVMDARLSEGGASPVRVREQIARARESLNISSDERSR